MTEVTRENGVTERHFPAANIKILLMEKISPAAVAAFRDVGFQVEEQVSLSEDELVEKIKGVHAIGVRSKTKLTARVLKAAEHLLCVGCFCIGTDQTDLSLARQMGIPVFNAPYANTRSVSELVIALIVMLARQAGDRNMELHAGTWNKQSKGCYEIRGKTLGVVGYGHVGTQLSIVAEAMGMKVLFYDIVPKLALGNASPCKTLEALLTASDFVSLHVPATPETKLLMGREQIFQMKKGSYLINYARGSCVDIEAAAEALKSGHLAGSAFDVFPVEPRGYVTDYKMALMGCPNTILTPHIGGSTEEAQKSIGEEVAGKLTQFICKGSTIGAVNVPEVGPSRALSKGMSRIVNFHQNTPGVMRDFNKVLEESNISAQNLSTMGNVGYMVVDLDSFTTQGVHESLKKMEHTVKTRILYQGDGYTGHEV